MKANPIVSDKNVWPTFHIPAWLFPKDLFGIPRENVTFYTTSPIQFGPKPVR